MSLSKIFFKLFKVLDFFSFLSTSEQTELGCQKDNRFNIVGEGGHSFMTSRDHDSGSQPFLPPIPLPCFPKFLFLPISRCHSLHQHLKAKQSQYSLSKLKFVESDQVAMLRHRKRKNSLENEKNLRYFPEKRTILSDRKNFEKKTAVFSSNIPPWWQCKDTENGKFHGKMSKISVFRMILETKKFLSDIFLKNLPFSAS